MSTIFNVNENVKSVLNFGLPFCDTIFSARLNATTDTTVTVPSDGAMGLSCPSTTNRYIAVMSYSRDATAVKDVFVALNTAAAAPAGAGFAATASELAPPAKYVKSGDVIHFFATTAATDVTVAFYVLQE